MGSIGPLSIGPDGPVIDVLVGVSDAFARYRRSRGLPVPSSMRVPFLVDTGASITVVTPHLVTQLQLQPRSGPQATTIAAGATVQSHQYDVSLVLPSSAGLHGQDLRIGNLLVAELTLAGAPYFGLIDRSVLGHCVLGYDGGAGTFRLDW